MAVDFEKVDLYKKYLNTVQPILDGYFEEQKEYICCQKGCAYCCEKGAYPFSEVEFIYLMLGFLKLDIKIREGVLARIRDLKAEYEKSEDKSKFMYRCPFLGEDKMCTVYDFRGIICRTFGLIQKQSDGKTIMAFCRELGLNYAKVFDFETKKIDYNKVKELGYKNIPQAYLIGLKNLMSKEFLGDNELEFGEIKSLIDWL